LAGLLTLGHGLLSFRFARPVLARRVAAVRVPFELSAGRRSRDRAYEPQAASDV